MGRLNFFFWLGGSVFGITFPFLLSMPGSAETLRELIYPFASTQSHRSVQSFVLSDQPFLIAQAPDLPTSPRSSGGSTTGPLLDEELQELRSSFSQIEAIKAPEFAISAPAYTINNPAGYGSGFGSVFFGAGGVFEQRDRNGSQFGVGLGAGVGDPNQIGLDVSYGYVFGENGSGAFNLKLHRNLISSSQIGWAAALGWDDLITTGDQVRDSSLYGATSVVFKLNPDLNGSFSRLALTLGVGGGRFRSEEDINNNRDSVGLFASAALRVNRSFSVITEWTGQDLAAGVSLAPFPAVNFYITPAARDILGAGDQVRFTLSAGTLFRF
jgi:hypothetical protein